MMHRATTRRRELRLSAFKLRAVSLASMAGILLVACGSSSGQSQNLASDQTMKFPYFGEFGTLDPGELSAEVDSEIAQNIFNGLTRFDNNLAIQPDIATDVPTTSNGGISADGLTYTFHLRKDVTFSNGDKVTSKDVLYSWNRSAAPRPRCPWTESWCHGYPCGCAAAPAWASPTSWPQGRSPPTAWAYGPSS